MNSKAFLFSALSALLTIVGILEFISIAVLVFSTAEPNRVSHHAEQFGATALMLLLSIYGAYIFYKKSQGQCQIIHHRRLT